MAKTNSARAAAAGHSQKRQSTKVELATFRGVVSVLKKDPARLREVAVKAGISTRTGKLKKAYGG